MSLPTTAPPDFESLQQPLASKGAPSRRSGSARCLVTGLVLSVLLVAAGGILFQVFRSFDQGVINACYGRYESAFVDHRVQRLRMRLGQQLARTLHRRNVDVAAVRAHGNM